MDDWRRHQDVYTSYDTTKTAYDLLKTAYNTANTADIAYNANTANKWLTVPVTVPTRPCKPDQPPAYTGPNIQFKDDLATIVASAPKRLNGQGTVTLTAVGD